MVRRKRNKIHGLHFPSGEWCDDEDKLRDEAVRFFKHLFCERENVEVDSGHPSAHVLPVEGQHTLTKAVTKEEVYQALLSMKSYKAPRQDSFQPIFFKMFWDEAGDEVWSFVRDAFASGHFDPLVIETLIVLIPKGDNPSSFRAFRPISLCNVIYKLISKVLVAQLRPFLNDLVSPHQSSFIQGRGTVDNAVVLQEVIHAMDKSKKKKGDLVLKLDLEKAYDRVDWRFLKSSLTCFGFPPMIISLIMHGISSLRSPFFGMGAGPLPSTQCGGCAKGTLWPPYLFVLCMERLGHMIVKEVEAHKWSPIQISKDGPKLSHLFFANDVLLFTKAKPSQARLVSNVLQSFCALSGLKVSIEKSRIYASKGVTNARKEKITRLTQIHFTTRLGKYLGFRLLHGRPRREDFEETMERITSKLAA